MKQLRATSIPASTERRRNGVKGGGGRSLFRPSSILLGSTNRYTDGSGRKLDGMDLPTDLYLQKMSNRAYPPKQEPWRKNQDHLMIASPQFSNTKFIGSGKRQHTESIMRTNQQQDAALRNNNSAIGGNEIAPTYKGNVVVSGAGVVGCVAASIFALRGWHVTVVEKKPAPVAPVVRRGSDIGDGEGDEEDAALQRLKEQQGGETFHAAPTQSSTNDSNSTTTGEVVFSSSNEDEEGGEEAVNVVDRQWDNRLVISNDQQIRSIEMTLLSKRGFDSMMAAGISKHELKQLGVQVDGVIDHPGGFNSWFTSGLSEEHMFGTNMLALDMPRLRAYLDTHLQRLPTENCRIFYSHKTVAAMSGSATREVAVQDLQSSTASVAGGDDSGVVADNIYHVPYDLLINAEGCNSTLRDLLDVEGESYQATYGTKWFALDELKEITVEGEEDGAEGRTMLNKVPWVLEHDRVHRWTYPCPNNTGNTIVFMAYPRQDSAVVSSSSSSSSKLLAKRSSFAVMAYMPMSLLEELSDSHILNTYLKDLAVERVHEIPVTVRRPRDDFIPLVDKNAGKKAAAGGSSTNIAVSTNFELQTFVPPGVARKDLVTPFPIVFCEELTNGNGYSTAVGVGDAAHTAHPFLQQNLNIALEDCSALINQVDGISRNFFEALKQYSTERGVAGDSLRVVSERSLYYDRAKHRNMLLRFRNRYAAFMHGVLPRKHNMYYQGSPNQIYGRSVEWMLNGRGYSPYERIESNQSRHHRWWFFTRYYV